MKFLRVLLFILVLLVLPLSLAIAQPPPFYTIQVSTTTNAEKAHSIIEDVARFVPLLGCVKKKGILYIVLAGKSQKKDDLEAYMEVLKKHGFQEAFLRKIEEEDRRGTGKYFLGKAWTAFNKGDYDSAVQFFSHILSFPETELDAKLGLAYCYVKQKKPNKAFLLLEELAKKRHKPKDVAAAIVPLLFERGDYKLARLYLKKLTGKERAEWEAFIREHEIRMAFSRAQEGGDLETLQKLVRTHQKILKSCDMPELFYDAAQMLAIRGKRQEGLAIYQDIMHYCSNRWDFRMASLYGLKEILPATEVVSLIQKELGRPKLPRKYRVQLEAFELDLYKGLIDTLDPASLQVKEMAEKILAAQPDDPFSRTALAWWYLHNKQYQTAYDMFVELNEEFIEEKGNKLEGLILSLGGLGRVEEAIRILEEAEIEVPHINRRIVGTMLSNMDSSTPESKIIAEKLLKLSPQSSQALTSLAWWNYHQGNYDVAYKMFLNLYQKSPEKKGKAQALLYTMLRLGKLDEALKLYEKAEIDNPSMKRNVLRLKLSLLYPSAPEVKNLSERILTMDPEDITAKSTLAWWYFHHGDYKTAYEKFIKLYEEDPSRKGNVSGLINTLEKLEDYDNALKIAARIKDKDEKFNNLLSNLYFGMASSAYKKEDYEKAEMYLKKSLSYDHTNSSGSSLLVWSLFKQGKLKDAAALAEAIYKRNNDPKLAESVLLMYDKLGKEKEADQFLSHLLKKAKKNEAYSKVVADEYLKRKWLIKAAQTYSDPETPYYNVHKPWFEVGIPYLRRKTGSPGKSKMKEYAFPVSYNYPLSDGRLLTFSLRPTFLESGRAEPDPNMGTDFRRIPQINNVITTLSSVVPEITYQQEGGDIEYIGKLGSTFLGGPLMPMPTFFAQAKAKRWKLELHQETVDTSMLSYAGQQDPYSNEKWGRVLKTGIEGTLKFTPFPKYWLSVKGGFDYFWGTKVWSNHSVHVSSAFGRSLATRFADVTLGLTLAGKLFDHDTDFHTFGHGGYFSPDLFYIYGPFMSVQSKIYRTYWFKGSYSYGMYHFESHSVPRYPLHPKRKERYDGVSVFDKGVSYRIEGFKLVTPQWAIGAFFSSNSTTDYKETETGIILRYYTEPRSKFIREK